MSDPVIGVVIRREQTEPRPAIAADMSTIGIIGPAPDADEDVFPLDTPVKGYSNDLVWLAKIGEAGFILDAIRGINDQLAEMQRAAQVVFVRTAEGVNADANLKRQITIAKIMGSSTDGTGMWAFVQSPEVVGATPRIIVAPGYTAQLATGVDNLTETTPGVGYVPLQSYALTFTGGGSGAVQATGYVVAKEDGTLDDPVITSPGAWYTAVPTVAVGGTAPSGTGATPAVFTAATAVLANPIVAGANAVLEALLAHAVFESAGTSQQADETWRETISSSRVIPVVGGVKVTDPVSGATVVRPFAPRVAGAIVRRDHETGGPFHSACNQPIYGILGPSRYVRFVITDGANEGQSLLGMNMGVLVKGEIGNDFAIANGGYVFLGTDNAGEDELWRFYNQTRGRDYIHIMLIRALRYYLGKFNVTGNTINACMNTMKNILRDLKANENIIDYKVGFKGLQNSAEEIRLGHITIAFAAEEPAPLRKITTRSARYRPAIDALVSSLEAQLNNG